jgi:hypothetical protein
MDEMANSAHNMVKSSALIPLFIKTPIIAIIYKFLGDKAFSNTLSNLGVVTMPTELAEHVDCMDFVLGPSSCHRADCAMITFGKTAVFTISKMTADPTFEEQLCRSLLEDDIEVLIERSPLYGR